MSPRVSFGLYVHVPFCATRCGYCSFYSETAGNTARYVDALLLELERARPRLDSYPPTSAFVGGGTPSWLPASDRDRLLDALAAHLAPGAEFTLECNPEDLDDALLDALERRGVNRLSLGVQSLDDGELRAVGRRHDADAARRALALAAARPLGLSVDLILGLPGQTPASWRLSLAGALEHAPEHLSLYCLELEPDAPLARRAVPVPADDAIADRYLETHDRLAAAGFEHYEVSNWCRPGAECRHNLDIWRGGDFLGLGPGAHSRVGGRRWSSAPDLGRWQAALLAGASPPGEEDRPGDAALRLERLLLALRTRSGLPLDGLDLASKAQFIKDLQRSSWAECEDGRLRLTPAGWLRLDGILAQLAT